MSYSDVKAENDALKVDVAWSDYRPTDLKSTELCGEKVCMSQDDFKQSEADIQNLYDLRNVDKKYIERLGSINNKTVDTLTAAEMEAHREREARLHTENALSKEKTSNWLKKIVCF